MIRNFPPDFEMVWKDHALSSKVDLVPIGIEYSIRISIIGALASVPPQDFMGWNKPTLAPLTCASQRMFYVPLITEGARAGEWIATNRMSMLNKILTNEP